MLKNLNHDLVKQLSETSSSLWRMSEYKKNAAECKECVALWEKIQKNLEEITDLLRKEICRHCKEGRFD